MKTFKSLLLLIVLILTACEGDHALFSFEDPQDEIPNPSESLNQSELIELTTSTPSLDLRINQLAKPNIIAHFENGGLFHNLGKNLQTPYSSTYPIVWFVNNPDVAEVDNQGVITAKNPGSTLVKVSVGKHSQIIEVHVREIENLIEEPSNTNDIEEDDEDTGIEDPECLAETPANSDDYFLNSNDIIALTLGANAGYGSNPSDFPANVHGTPHPSNTDVVSLGDGGILDIELGGFWITDCDGPDFVIFENAFVGWTERAQISVSEDGNNYVPFPCEPFNSADDFPGCAGVNPVNHSSNSLDYLNPDFVGGDQFDLADVGLETVRYIRITDMETCTGPCAGSSGFDSDGLAIFNGINEF